MLFTINIELGKISIIAESVCLGCPKIATFEQWHELVKTH